MSAPWPRHPIVGLPGLAFSLAILSGLDEQPGTKPLSMGISAAMALRLKPYGAGHTTTGSCALRRRFKLTDPKT
jgi:hypothetical protein